MRAFVIAAVMSVVFPNAAQADGFSLSVGKGAAVIEGIPGVMDMSGRIGFLTGQTVIYGAMDMASLSLEEDGESFDNGLITLGGGVKYLMARPGDNVTTSYIVAQVFTVIASSEEEFVDSASSFGALAGFGGEYFLSDQFSLGGEMGLSAFTASSEADGSDFSATVTQIYTSIQLNYYFGAAAPAAQSAPAAAPMQPVR